MQDYILLLFILVACHFLCDYPLQNDFVAKYKARKVDGKYNNFWYHCLTGHAFIHALPVLIFTQNVYLGLLMVVTHWLTDFAKCEGKITLNQDQFIHISVVVLIATIHWSLS